MANIEIAGKDFMNYTDCRPKGVCTIENESIINYARSLSDEQMRIFLSVVPYMTLMEECSRKFYELEIIDKGLKRLIGIEIRGTDYGKQQYFKYFRNSCK